jgi:hypothetical protein
MQGVCLAAILAVVAAAHVDVLDAPRHRVHCPFVVTDAPAQNHLRSHRLDVAAHITVALCAGAELWEDAYSLGHHHGVALLCLSKFCRELNTLTSEASDASDASESVEAAARMEEGGSAVEAIGGRFWSVVKSPRFHTSLAMLAMFAALTEVLEDVADLGGHHGAVLLALVDLQEVLAQQWHAIRETLPAALQLPVSLALESAALRVFLLVGALVGSVFDVVASSMHGAHRVGAHHGVAVLSISKLAFKKEAIKVAAMLRGATHTT